MVNFGRVAELPPYEQGKLDELARVFNYHADKNKEKARYYDGFIPLSEVNLGIALPRGFSNLEIGCEWGAKAVDVLAGRSMLDGFVGDSGEDSEVMRAISDNNKLISEYAKAVRDQLIYGCTFATLSAQAFGCSIRFHSPESAAALWSGEKGRIDCGFAIIETIEDEQTKKSEAVLVNLYTDSDIWTMTKGEQRWHAERHPHRMGRPLMEALVYNPTSKKPFGRSRLKFAIRNLIRGYVRTIANATIGLEFATSPQKYLLGVTDEQMDAVISDKFRQYVGSIITSTANPENGEKPTFGQLPQGSIVPHVEMMRLLATQFSANTGLSVTDTGVINDANPTSSDAIFAQSQTLINMAEQLNNANGEALKLIAQMAQAIERGATLDELTDEERAIVPHFKNPAMPSVSVTADAAVKIAASRPEFAQTDVFLEMVGFDQSDIRRIKGQETRARGQAVLMEFE